jgi:hypothetical protein
MDDGLGYYDELLFYGLRKFSSYGLSDRKF